jgi:hypothetical protein
MDESGRSRFVAAAIGDVGKQSKKMLLADEE